jgi:putative transcriptional regulator
MTIKEMRAQSGLSQSKFAAMFNIPVRTLQAWEQEQSTPPEYVIRMMERIIQMEKPASDFNPFYDSEFLIAYAGEEERRLLVELTEDELLELRAEINTVLQRRGAK